MEFKIWDVILKLQVGGILNPKKINPFVLVCKPLSCQIQIWHLYVDIWPT
jgi:hypothetical protein